MKHLILIITILATAAGSMAAPLDPLSAENLPTPNSALSALSEPQSLEELNAAARDQIVRELGLTGSKRKEFEALYTSYRKALDQAVNASADTNAPDENAQRRNLKAKLTNISATARVKSEYVDKFAAVLSAEQIRQLYNAEGAIGTNIKRTAANRRSTADKLKGSGRMVTQDRGSALSYSVLSVGHGIEVVVSPTAQSIKVTADDNVADYVKVEQVNGTLRFGINARSSENISVSVVVPASAALSQIDASSYSKVICTTPLKGGSVKIGANSGASVTADAEAGSVNLTVSGYAKYSGSIRATDCTAQIGNGATVESTISGTSTCTLDASAYSKFSGGITARILKIDLASGADVQGPFKADDLTLWANSYAKLKGPIQAQQAALKATSGATISGEFTANTFSATGARYANIDLAGTSKATKGEVELASGAVLDAPGIEVANYFVTVTSYSKANISCTDKLTIDASSGGTVNYKGNPHCNVTSQGGHVVRK